LRYAQLRGEIEACLKPYAGRRFFPQGNEMITARFFFVMKPTPIISEKKAALVIWIGAAVFTIGAMIFGH
jgi:hypothetical protein